MPLRDLTLPAQPVVVQPVIELAAEIEYFEEENDIESVVTAATDVAVIVETPVVAVVVTPVEMMTEADLAVVEALKERIFDANCDEIRVSAEEDGTYSVFLGINARLYEAGGEINIKDAAQARRIISHFILANTSNGSLEDSAASLVTKGTFRLKDGNTERISRVQVFYPPVTYGPSFLLQLTSLVERDLENLIAEGAMDLNLAYFLKTAVVAGASIVFSGIPGAGKTTLMSACAQEIPNEERGTEPAEDVSPEMLILIQEIDEISLRKMVYKTKFFSFEEAARALGMTMGNGLSAAGSTSDLVEIIKVARGNRVVLGECRGAEMYDYLEAASIFGGSMTTMHAKGAYQAIDNTVQFAMRNPNAVVGGLEGVRSLTAKGVDLVVHMAVVDGRRLISEVLELDGSLAGGTIRSQRIWAFNRVTGAWDRPEGSALSDREGRLLSRLTLVGLPNVHATPIA
jgi:Flp pilus assembly CpaF family ATPase